MRGFSFAGFSCPGLMLETTRWLPVAALFWSCAVWMAPPPASAIELGENGHYSKLTLLAFTTTESFDLEGNRKRFALGGMSRFVSLTAEYRYGISDRLNLGVLLPWVSNSFEDDLGSDSRRGLQDVTAVGEYRFLDFEQTRRVASLRAAVTFPTGYETGRSRIWLGNGTTDLLVGGTIKGFLLPTSEFDRSWYEIDIAVKRALTEIRANLDGTWGLPVRLGLNYRPRYRYVFGGALVGSFNDRREFLGAEGAVRFRISQSGEIEVGIAEILRGENSSAGTVFLVGFLVNTGRVWQ